MTRALALLAILAASPAFAQADYGGRIVDYYDQPSGPITGYCASACTLRLMTAPCVARDAVLYFHHATTALGTRIMGGAAFKPKLRRLFWLHPEGFELTGRDLGGFGYRICE